MANKTLHILVVEDEKLLLEAITKKLELNSFTVTSCASGDQALAALQGDTDLPDAIWLDYYLKDMSGLEFMQIVNQNASWRHIPVVVVSNSASPDKVKNMLALGASRYLLKAEHRLEDIISIFRGFIESERGTS